MALMAWTLCLPDHCRSWHFLTCLTEITATTLVSPSTNLGAQTQASFCMVSKGICYILILQSRKFKKKKMQLSAQCFNISELLSIVLLLCPYPESFYINYSTQRFPNKSESKSCIAQKVIHSYARNHSLWVNVQSEATQSAFYVILLLHLHRSVPSVHWVKLLMYE